MADAFTDRDKAFQTAEFWIQRVATEKNWPRPVLEMGTTLLLDAFGGTDTVDQFWLTAGVLFDKADDPGGPAADYAERGWRKLSNAFYSASTAANGQLDKAEQESLWTQIKGAVEGTANDIRGAVKDGAKGAGGGAGMALPIVVGLAAYFKFRRGGR